MAIFNVPLDLHCGGIDLIFPHHEDEIAQSEGATGVTFSRHWCHSEFLLMEGAKMAKRVGNVVTVADLQSHGVPAAAVRHLIYNTHYRQVLNLTDEGLEASRHAVLQFAEFAERLASPVPGSGTNAMAGIVAELKQGVREALFNDLNSPQALAAAFKFVRAANADLDRKGGDKSACGHAQDGLNFIDETLGILPPKRLMGIYPSIQPSPDGESPADVEMRRWVEGRLAERAAARAARDFAKSDAIRDELAKQGIQIADSGIGTTWKKVG
jgi:cysteinyl-tRNA synthetase